MNNLYQKVAFTSVGIALGFVLVPNKEAKAAIFTLTSATSFVIEDDSNREWRKGIYSDVLYLRTYFCRKRIGDLNGTTSPKKEELSTI